MTQIAPVNMKPLTLWEKINLYFKPLLIAEDKELIVTYKIWKGVKFIFDIKRKIILGGNNDNTTSKR